MTHAGCSERLVLTAVNSAAERILGISSTADLGMTIEQTIPPLEKTDHPDQY